MRLRSAYGRSGRAPGTFDAVRTWNPVGYIGRPAFQRAVENFTQALSYPAASAEQHAAYAGRATAHLWLGNWSDALADPRQVPDDFQLVAEIDDSESGLYNCIWEATSKTFRSHTVWFTWYEDSYAETGDPRIPWEVDPDFSVAVGSLSGLPGGSVPYLPQRKYTSRTDDTPLSSGWEMRLVEAEAILQGAGFGSWQEAMDIPNWEDPSHPGHTPLFIDWPRGPPCFDSPSSERDRNPNVPTIGG